MSSFAPFIVFGWKLHFKKMKVGERFQTLMPNGVQRDSIDSITYWVKGRIEGVHSDPSFGPVAPRVAGFYALRDMPEHVPPGHIDFVCVEDSEWWCVNYTMNRRKLPSMDPLFLPSGSSMQFAAGDRALVCRGHGLLDGQPTPTFAQLEPSATATFVASVDTYMLKFLQGGAGGETT